MNEILKNYDDFCKTTIKEHEAPMKDLMIIPDKEYKEDTYLRHLRLLYQKMLEKMTTYEHKYPEVANLKTELKNISWQYLEQYEQRFKSQSN